MQAPLKDRYRSEPQAARVTLSAAGSLGEDLSCSVRTTGQAIAQAGLHPATDGDGSLLCSGDMPLEALVACGGSRWRRSRPALEISVESGHVCA
ncbi:MAG: OsmC family peroxiredoxin, partial [Actinobacteria bacterium]|nr:OsmC family peroxiredoxin [Actinomycetota bacterium]MCA1698989.1 OsmC family peroxiredoxin [Actinomycetota bacterium]